MSYSVIIPAYNEERAIGDVLTALTKSAEAKEHHIIVIDDGSTDKTAMIVRSFPTIELIQHPYNKGYGASLKTGIEASKSEWCITYDADGQHTPDLLPLLEKECHKPNDMVVGARQEYRGPWMRKPGKWILHVVAEWLTARRIPDLNSGLRAFRKSTFLKFAHLLSNGFSLSTTSTVAFFRANCTVVYVPVSIQYRTGISSVRMRDGWKTLMLIVRLIMVFSPLRVFLPISFIFGILTIGDFWYEFTMTGDLVNTSSIALLTLASFTFFFGLLADQIACIRREQFLS